MGEFGEGAAARRVKEEAQTLIIAFYFILFLYPVARWLVHRYTAKAMAMSQQYLESLSAKISEAKGAAQAAAKKVSNAKKSDAGADKA